MISKQKILKLALAIGLVLGLLGIYVKLVSVQKESAQALAMAQEALGVRSDTYAIPDGGLIRGASSPGFAVGTQLLQSGQASGFNMRYENMVKFQQVAAGGTVTFGTIPVPLGPEGIGEYWGDVFFTADGIDAATNCDGGICSAIQEMKIAVDIHGGQCCLIGGSLCSTDGGGGLGTYTINNVPSTGVASGFRSQVICNAAAQTLSIQATLGSVSSGWVGGIISHGQFAAPSNAGVDAADAADSSDAADAADSSDSSLPPAPTLLGFSNLAPDFGSTAGQTSAGTGCGATGVSACKPIFTASGTSLVGATSFKLNGVEHIGSVTVAATTVSINTILSGTAGQFTTVSIAGPWVGSPTTYGDGATIGWTYLPASYHYWVPEFVTFGSGAAVATWTDVGDLSASTPTQATAGNQCAQVTGGSGINGRAACSIAHTGDTYPFSSLAALTQGQAFFVGKAVGTGSTYNALNAGSDVSGTMPLFGGGIVDDFGSSSLWAPVIGFTSPVTTTTMTVPNVYETSLTSGGAAHIYINGTQQTAPTGVAVSFSSTPALFGGNQASTVGNLFGAFIVYASVVNSGANRTVIGKYLSGRYNVTTTY